MKKLGMLLALGGLMGGAQAQTGGNQTGTQFVDIGQDVIVHVQNVCAFVGGGVIDSNFDQNSSELHPDAIEFNYKATASSGAGQRIFNIRCTAGTDVRLTGGAGGMSYGFGEGANQNDGYRLSKVGSSTSQPLLVNITETFNRMASDGSNTSPDRYTLNTRVQAPAGQWGVSKGDYSTVLIYRFAYDE